ncbi:NAD(P)H-quinone oxidoreductase [Kocuria palustris]|uniref:NAD(P)H-quinone oxidoreductase n=1 Tax=Kocuria palustris TaxID=71999 RepID=UPI00119E27C3|nr:NAD(P)H-quinone oxidoreductase [Kocuria palustris]
MRAVAEAEHGGPEVLSVTDQPAPELTADGIRIRVEHVGINRADVLQRTGNYKVPEGGSTVYGLEVSGHVVEVGDDAAHHALDGGVLVPGARVCALMDSGGYAEEVVAPAANVLPVPDALPMSEAAALPEVLATVWSNLVMEAGADSGQTLLLHGGTGGVGTAAIQIARAIGMRVITTVSSEAKAEFVRELGAEPIRYDQEDFVERAKQLTGGRGPEIIFDVVGAKYLAPNLEALAADGTLIIIGLQGGRKAEIDLSSFMVRRQHLVATTLRARPAEQKAAIMAQVHEHVWPKVVSGQVRAIVDREFPLEQAAQAHEHFDSGTHIGKILLTP